MMSGNIAETIEEMTERLYNIRMLPPMDPLKAYDTPVTPLTEERIYAALEQHRKEADAFANPISHRTPNPGQRYP
jgi:hypothetical protein